MRTNAEQWKQYADKISGDNITGYAAQSCFYITLSFLPFLLVLMNLVRFLPVTENDIIALLKTIAPEQFAPFFENIILDIYNHSSLTLTSVTAVTALWSAGKGFMAVLNGLNNVYDTPADSNWIRLRIKSTVYTLAFMLVIVSSLTLLVFGDSLVQLLDRILPSVAVVLNAILSNRLILFSGLLILIFLLIYTYVPNRKSSLMRELPGAIISAFGWYLFSSLYSLYINYMPSRSYMYGGLATLIFALIWLYFCMIIMFFGAEVNVLLACNKKSKPPHKTEQQQEDA